MGCSVARQQQSDDGMEFSSFLPVTYHNAPSPPSRSRVSRESAPIRCTPMTHNRHCSLAIGGSDEQRDQRALSETCACRFRNRLLADLSAWPRVAFGLGLAWWRGQLLFADDQRCLSGPRHFSDCRCKESCRKPQPDFLHHLVEPRTCGNHGGSGAL